MDDVTRFYVRINAAAICFIGESSPVLGRVKEAALLLAQRDGLIQWEAAGRVLDMAESGMTLRAIEAACRGH